MPNGKTPGIDGVYGFWFKKFPYIFERLAIKMNRCTKETCILVLRSQIHEYGHCAKWVEMDIEYVDYDRT